MSVNVSGMPHPLRHDSTVRDSSPEESLHIADGHSAAESLWRDDPDSAFAGLGLLSAESSAAIDHSDPLLALTTSNPARFLSLVADLPPLIADILIQYYLLGRTYAQIGALLFPRRSRNAQCIAVKLGNRYGRAALAALIRCGSPSRILARGPNSPFRRAWDRASQWRAYESHRPATLRSPRDLGDFVITPNGQLSELFAPSWSVLGPSAGGGSESL